MNENVWFNILIFCKKLIIINKLCNRIYHDQYLWKCKFEYEYEHVHINTTDYINEYKSITNASITSENLTKLNLNIVYLFVDGESFYDKIYWSHFVSTHFNIGSILCLDYSNYNIMVKNVYTNKRDIDQLTKNELIYFVTLLLYHYPKISLTDNNYIPCLYHELLCCDHYYTEELQCKTDERLDCWRQVMYKNNNFILK